MGFMKRYRHLIRVDGRSLPKLPKSVSKQVTDACRQIEARCKVTAWYHCGNSTVQYHFTRTPTIAPVADYLITNGRYHPISVRDSCSRLLRARMSRKRKDYEIAKIESNNKSVRENEINKLADDCKGSLVGELLHNIRKIQNPHSQRVFATS